MKNIIEQFNDIRAGVFPLEKMDKRKMKLIFAKALDLVSNTFDYTCIADSIIKNLNDFVYAREIYKMAEYSIVDIGDYSIVASSVALRLKDLTWAIKILTKEALVQAKTCWDYIMLGDSIAESLQDTDWAKKMYLLADGLAKTSHDFCLLANSIDFSIKDKKWSEELYIKAYNTAVTPHDSYYLMNSLIISNRLYNNFNLILKEQTNIIDNREFETTISDFRFYFKNMKFKKKVIDILSANTNEIPEREKLLFILIKSMQKFICFSVKNIIEQTQSR
ncbi:MAG: hypothetical protein HW421_3892 [Ignavibacteria bacterium]|nr:hypothetical protein [Ignavibacteria bacterium]